MSDPTGDIQEQLDRYLDGLLEGQERNAFEQRMAGDAGLREQVQAQSAIDVSLRRIFAPPSNGRLRPILSVLPGADAEAGGPAASEGETSADPASGRTAKRWRTWRIVAAPLGMAALLVAGVLTYQYSLPKVEPVSGLRRQTFGEVYEQTLASGFTPQYVCDNDQDFAVSFYLRLQQGLHVDRPAHINWVGVSRAETKIITTRTHYVLVRVNGTPVLVFVDILEQDNDKANKVPPNLHVFRRTMDKLVLYEVTPLDSPQVIERISEITLPPEWLKIAQEKGAW